MADLKCLGAGASITRDDARNHTVYGEDVLAADVIAGRVTPPQEARIHLAGISRSTHPNTIAELCV